MRLVGLWIMLAVWASPAFALNILLVNDDGFETANIQALHRALVAAGHDVILVAPYVGQSGTGGQIEVMKPLGPTGKPSEHGLLPAGSPGIGETTIAPNQFYVNSSPVVTAAFGLDVYALKRWGRAPDLVLSGPNEGNNMGVVTPHSGTLGATVFALNRGIPAIAVSADNGDADQAVVVAQLVVRLLDSVVKEGEVRLPAGLGLNVNTPRIDTDTSAAADFRFAFTQLGDSANIGLMAFENLGDSAFAQSVGVPADIGLPGLSIAVPPSEAGYAADDSRRSESNRLAGLVVTVSPIEGTYAADKAVNRRVKRALRGLF